jgi:hypothetical protein
VAGVLAAGFLAVGLSALAAAPASATGFDWQSYRSHDTWKYAGHSATTGGVKVTWPTNTYDVDANVCPNLDTGHIEVKELTVVAKAPEGKLIASYCVKAGSDNQGLGPKLVVLDNPVAEVTIGFADVQKHTCKNISHYSLAYVDATEETTPPTETTPPAETTPPTEETTPPTEETTPPTEETTPPTEETTPPADEVTPPADETTPPAETPLAETPADAPSDSPAAVVPGDDDSPSPEATLAATDEGSSPAEAVVDDTPRLAATGAEVGALVAAAVALIGAGALVVLLRRRAQA